MVLILTDISSQVITTVGSIILLLLLGTGGLALGRAIAAARTDRHNREVRRSVREWFDERVTATDPAWRSAVRELSDSERRVLTDLLEERLRDPSESRPPELETLAAALDVQPDFERVPRRRHERLETLNWAALLGRDVDPEALATYVTDDRDEREAAARVLLASSAPDARQTATELLLRDEPLSVFGLDTLYRHHRSDASDLVRIATDRRESMDPATLTQILSVAGECNRPTDGAVDDVADCLSHESARVRAATSRTLTAWDAPIPEDAPGTGTRIASEASGEPFPEQVVERADGDRGPADATDPGMELWRFPFMDPGEGSK